MHFINVPADNAYCVLPIPLKNSFNKWENWNLEKLKDFIQGHTATEWQNQDLNPGYLLLPLLQTTS